MERTISGGYVIAAITTLFFPALSPVILASVVIFKLSDGVSELCYSYLHKQQAFNLAAKSQVTRALVATLVLIFVSLASHSVPLTFIAWCATHVLFAIRDIRLIAKQIPLVEQRPFTLKATLLAPHHWQVVAKLYRQYWPVGIAITFWRYVCVFT